jgi:uncharacterized RmlC-like cupin family protein
MSADPTPTCRVLSGEQGSYAGKQGLDYGDGISAESVGARGICLVKLTMPPGARAKAHLHEHHETAIHVLSGVSHFWWGERLEHLERAGPGDYVYIPAGVPHLPANFGDEPVVAIIARTDPNEQESVVLRPDLDDLPHLRAP